ncbi:hypothetical protein RAB80_018107 [Fusarium oxysporum f. sp. vasinfectum]|uniref:C2H2-type domain-containing protein n=1 Tax=Fusarium oxysporum f. sp. vasinfectum 25433 TaxID=1089449 RepID=X0LWK8_FUSOX|nr:hypothetical protein FOTG_18682 [Fusarium oxysporum f. sp. vasinfectum 25433]KAK2666450.1 hypothetical protein RAB80_018107 [Fusarium oxysporum f. sp. vasinfectum]KAK2923289.1 hypothetical protein FoTM2_016811 [Fusarium oxysporum f. sp. vasinfectum]
MSLLHAPFSATGNRAQKDLLESPIAKGIIVYILMQDHTLALFLVAGREKPHQCLHIGCEKRFADASTLARHRRRLHQQEINPNDINDCSSNSDDDGSPSTPQLPMNQSASNGPLHRASSCADFESQFHGHHMLQHYDNQRGISATVPNEYHGTPVSEQYTPVQLVHQAAAMIQQVYYVTEAGKPGVATMTSTVPAHYQLSQQVERPSLELPYSAPGIATSIQSSPSTFSATSVLSSMIPEGFYAHQPGSQPAYTAAEPQPAMIEYQQLIQQPLVSQLQYIPATTGYYAPPPAHPQQEQWPYYHPPIEVTTTGQLPAYGPAVYDTYGPKIEFEDPSLQPLSIRLASM